MGHVSDRKRYADNSSIGALWSTVLIDELFVTGKVSNNINTQRLYIIIFYTVQIFLGVIVLL